MHTDVVLVSATFPVTVRYSFWARFFILMYTAGYNREKQRNLEKKKFESGNQSFQKRKTWRGSETWHGGIYFLSLSLLFPLANMYKFSIDRSLDHWTQSLNYTISIILFWKRPFGRVKETLSLELPCGTGQWRIRDLMSLISNYCALAMLWEAGE